MADHMSTKSDAANDPLQCERRGQIWFARLNRPDKRNALSEELLERLGQVCAQVTADLDARALVLWGAGGHFCAGADFVQFLDLMSGEPGHGEDPIVAHNRGFGTMLELLASLPVPTLAIVRGAAMGGGCGLAAACDRVIASEDAVFAMPEVTLGVAPAQIAPFVARRIGATRARWLMLSAARLPAAAARDAGLADIVVPAAELAATVRQALLSLAAAEPAALRATKRIVNRALQSGLPDALDEAAREFAGLLRHGAAREGIAATRERRPPAWQAPLPEFPDFT
jgi:isohexenylglutaconyl-CoA hydratase